MIMNSIEFQFINIRANLDSQTPTIVGLVAFVKCIGDNETIDFKDEKTTLREVPLADATGEDGLPSVRS